MILGGKQCKGKKLTGVPCRYTATEREYCYYCNALLRGMPSAHPGYDPRKGRINGFDWIDGRKGGVVR